MALAEQFPHCEICPIILDPPPNEQDLRIYEGDGWFVTLRGDNQALLGTTYITAREHWESLDQVPPAVDEEFRVIRNQLYRAIGAAFAPDVINISCLMNYAFRDNGKPGFTPQPHVHHHVHPRYKTPRFIAGEEFTDPEFAGPISHTRKQRVGLLVARTIASEIRTNWTLAA